jgi:hypothetical protein
MNIHIKIQIKQNWEFRELLVNGRPLKKLANKTSLLTYEFRALKAQIEVNCGNVLSVLRTHDSTFEIIPKSHLNFVIGYLY